MTKPSEPLRVETSRTAGKAPAKRAEHKPAAKAKKAEKQAAKAKKAEKKGAARAKQAEQRAAKAKKPATKKSGKKKD